MYCYPVPGNLVCRIQNISNLFISVRIIQVILTEIWSLLPIASPYEQVEKTSTQESKVKVVKVKAIPLQAGTDPGGSRRLRLSDIKTIGT